MLDGNSLYWSENHWSFTPSCGGGGSGGVITVYIPSVYLNNTLTAINNSYALTTAEKNFLTNNSAITSNLANYIRANNNQQGAATIKWAINYLSQPQNSQIATYYNQNSVNLKNILFNDTNLNDADNIATNVAVANVITDFLRAKSSGNIDQILSTNNLISWDQIKINIKNYVKSKIPDAVRMGKMVYSFFKENIPDTKINALNQNYIHPLRSYVQANGNVNTDVHTMKWKDIVACWLFELGDFPINNSTGLGTMPTIGFAGADYTISGIPNQLNQMRYLSAHKTLSNGSFSSGSVMQLKNDAINQIKFQNNLSPLNGEWIFNFDAGVDTIKNLDGFQFTLGSYQTTVHITALGNNQYKLTFVVKNKTGWTSGTRGLNDNDNNPNNDSGFPDKPIGTGIHLGGTIGQTFGWYEIVTVP